MKTIGIVGGITWLSSIEYYRLINEIVQQRTGENSTAKVILYSLDFGEIRTLTEADQWNELASITASAAQKLEAAGADCILIGANTMHKIADAVQRLVNIPLIHIAEVTAQSIAMHNIKKVALLGTKYTMQLDFYKEKLSMRGISVIIPDEEDIEYLNYTIYHVMGKGIFTNEIKERVQTMIDKLVAQGAEGIILGCTELPILIKQEDCIVPIFDTVLLHATAAVDFSLSPETVLAE